MRLSRMCGVWWVVAAIVAGGSGASALAQGVVPGSGVHVSKVGDDFEDPDWAYRHNNPKNSYELDQQSRPPAGTSANGRWFEGPLRGHPDLVKRVETPVGGLPGSLGSLLLRSQNTGRPGISSRRAQQDDLIANVRSRLGGTLPVAWQPSVVVRVFVPPLEEWEPRAGTSFAFRAGVRGVKTGRGLEEYWPGILVNYYPANPRRRSGTQAGLRLRAGPTGADVEGPRLEQPGWWTLGMSFTPDGAVHYYARRGVDNLTEADHLASHFPYGYRCREFETFFFDVLSLDDGRTWSTEWIVDDPALYIIKP